MNDTAFFDLLKAEHPKAATPAATKEDQQTDDFLDKMVAEASIPNLVTLLKQGIEAGLVSPQPKYK